MSGIENATLTIHPEDEWVLSAPLPGPFILVQVNPGDHGGIEIHTTAGNGVSNENNGIAGVLRTVADMIEGTEAETDGE